MVWHNNEFVQFNIWEFVFQFIAPTRWKLRSAVRIVNETLGLLKVEQHPDKTFIGRVDRGFDFLGYFIKPGVLKVSRGTFERFTERISRLYEQGAVLERIEEYVKHWFKWVRSGIGTWVNKKENESIKKHPHPSANEECRCLCNESIIYLVFIYSSLFPSASYLISCESDYSNAE